MKEEIFVHYASALFSLAKEEGKLPAYLAEMRDVLNTLKDNPDFVAFCASYRIPNENAYSLLETVFGSLKCKSIVPFLKLAVTKHLFSHIEDICEAFFSLCNEELGIKEGIVYSTSLLSQKEISEIEKALEKRLSSKVSLRNRVDANLLGGVKVAIDGKIFDGSLQAKVEGLRKKLLKGGTL